MAKDLENIKGQFGGLNKVVGKLGVAIAAAFSVHKLIEFGKACVNVASDLQEVGNVVDVTFTNMSGKVDKFAKMAYKTAGMSELMAKKFIGTYGAMSKSFGFTEQEAYDMSASLTQAAGDMASFHNLSQNESFTKLKAVYTGETEGLKDVGIVMTQAALDQYALANGFGHTTAQMSEQEKVALRYQFVMSKLKDVHGDFIRTSGSWANQTRVLSLQFEQLKASIGTGLINVLTPILRIINLVLEKLQVLGQAFAEFTGLIFGNASENASTGTSHVAENIESAVDSAEDLADGIGDVGKAAKNAQRDLAGFDQINRLSKKESGAGAGSQKGKNKKTQIAGFKIPEFKDNLSPKLSQMTKSVEKILEKLSVVFEPTIAAWNNAIDTLTPIILGVAEDIGLAWENLKYTYLLPFVSYILEQFVPNIINTVTTTLAPIFTDLLGAEIKLLGIDFSNMAKVAGVALDTVKKSLELVETVFSDMCQSISDHWDTYGAPLIDKFIEFKNGMWEIFWSIYDKIIKPVIDNV